MDSTERGMLWTAWHKCHCQKKNVEEDITLNNLSVSKSRHPPLWPGNLASTCSFLYETWPMYLCQEGYNQQQLPFLMDFSHALNLIAYSWSVAFWQSILLDIRHHFLECIRIPYLNSLVGMDHPFSFELIDRYQHMNVITLSMDVCRSIVNIQVWEYFGMRTITWYMIRWLWMNRPCQGSFLTTLGGIIKPLYDVHLRTPEWPSSSFMTWYLIFNMEITVLIQPNYNGRTKTRGRFPKIT
jgi:hypothetical protein